MHPGLSLKKVASRIAAVIAVAAIRTRKEECQ